MRKQLLKGFTMLLVVMTLAIVTAVAANAQTMSLKANIPFSFVVGDQNLSAGSYTVRSLTSSGDTLRIMGVDTKGSAARLTIPARGKSNQAKLVFHRYGQSYFLAEVWSSSEDGRELTTSKAERAIQKEASRIASAKPAQRAYETVELLAAIR